MDEDRSDEERGPARRPRVIDKRVSARPEAPAQPRETAPEPPASAPPPATAPPAPAAEQGAPQPETKPEEDLWTPEQEAEARRVVEEIARVPAADWIADSAVRLANVAGVKLDRGELADAQLAIDGLAALVAQVGARLGEAEAPLRQTLAQLQLAFAQSAAGPPAQAP
jgi:hypothetical protein